MGYFVTPKHSGSIDNFIYPLLVLFEHTGEDEWMSLEDFKISLFNKYVSNNIDSEWVLNDTGQKVMKNDPSDYTKDLQLPAYFGFVDADTFNRDSKKRITPLGKRLVEAYYQGENTLISDEVKDLFLESMENVSFGCNNYGVISSKSNFEAPAIFLKSAIILDGLSAKELAYIIYQLDTCNKDYSEIIIDVMRMRKLNLSFDCPVNSDIKFITLFKNLGIVSSGPQKNRNYVCSFYLEQRYERVSALPIDNTNKQQIAINDNIENNIYFDPDNIYTPTMQNQIIYYGAPGTGKSDHVDRTTSDHIRYRTTFHPDTDYSSFVGCYKPTMNGKDIEYSFVPQVFLKAYVSAWNNPVEPVYLIIEELNRGNCAQIFGDMFQLLDRKDNGYSSYLVRPDQDILRYLENGVIVDGEKVDYIKNISMYNSVLKEQYPKDSEYLGKGDKIDCMALPKNLHIIATMNTSDQSLFPMDSAFKRRWDWEYIKINYEHKDLVNTTLKLGQTLKWVDVLKSLNTFIKNTNLSTTKQLGEWFVKPDENNQITQETFINKVLFFLFNDAFRDNDEFRELFGTGFYFEDFYTLSEKEQSDLILEFFKKSLNIVVNGISNNSETSEETAPEQEQPGVEGETAPEQEQPGVEDNAE